MDAVVVIKSAKSSCAAPGTRCVGAVLSTANAATPAAFGTVGVFFPTGEPLFVRAQSTGTRMWIAETRNNFVEVMLPRAAGQSWQPGQERYTRRQVRSLAGTAELEDEDFVSLDAQSQAVAQMGSGRPLPAGAPFLYRGDVQAPARDNGVRDVQTVLDRLAATQPLDSAPIVDFSTCLNQNGHPVAQFMARSLIPEERTRLVVVCTDTSTDKLTPDELKAFSQLWQTRVWIALLQATASIHYTGFQQSLGRNAEVSLGQLVTSRSLSDLVRVTSLDTPGQWNLLFKLNDLTKLLPASVVAEGRTFERQVVQPTIIALVCATHDVSGFGAEDRKHIAAMRTNLAPVCSRIAGALPPP